MSKGNRTRRIAAGLLPEIALCSARRKDGTPCTAHPIRGATVCRMHGGSAPQVKEAAAKRLREGVMPMLATLYRLANDDSLPPAVQLAAVRDWLDRSGIKEAITVEVTVQPWERIVDGILAEVPDDMVTLERMLDDNPVPALPAARVPAATAPALGPGEVRIPSRRKRQGGVSR